MIQNAVNSKDLNVSRETIEKLEIFAQLIEKWTKTINLISPSSIPELWDRHILDSVQVYQLAPKRWQSWVDLGSGGGLPGIVVAILDERSQPITLVESDKRKCLFLKTVRRELSLDIRVCDERIEDATLGPATVVSARALAPLDKLLGYCHNLLSPDGVALFSKGVRYQDELDEAATSWHFDVTAHPSQTEPDARILKISRISRREA